MGIIKIPKRKIWFLISLVILYVLFAVVVRSLLFFEVITPPISLLEDETKEFTVEEAILSTETVNTRLRLAQHFFTNNFVEENRHINLVHEIKQPVPESGFTNSEAVSYYILWNAQARNKKEVDLSLAFIKEHMIHPQAGFLMWKLNELDIASDDGRNAATDAELRVIKALAIAYENWGDEQYLQMINELGLALEESAITTDMLFAPYAIHTQDGIITPEEVWLSYTDFTAFNTLAQERGRPWRAVHKNMKEYALDAQISSGLYRIQLRETREFHNDLDAGDFSINALWMLVRNAESGDRELRESARQALEFYKTKFETDGKIALSYGESGQIIDSAETPWAYAILARGAIELNDREFADKLIERLLEFQVSDAESDLYGAIPEGATEDLRVSQFTMQESILTLQSYLAKYTVISE